jgi:predicted MFS family arabinose efflux permease
VNGSTREKSFWLSAAFWTLIALFGMNLLNYIDRFILAAVLEMLGKDVPMNETQEGTVGSIFYVSYAVFSPVVGWLGDRVRRKYLLAAGVGVWSLATAGTGLCVSFGQLLLARSVLGVGEATYAILAPTLIADLFPREQRNRALTFFYLAVPFGAAFGYPLGAFIGTAAGWRTAFFVVGLPGLLVALSATLLKEPPRGGTEGVDEEHRQQHEALPFSWDIYRRLLRTPSYLYNCLGMAMFTFAMGGLQFFAPKFFSTVRHIDPQNVGLYLGAVIVVSGLVGTSLGGWLGDRLVPRLSGAYFWMCGVTMAASIPFILLALLATDPLVIFGSLVVGLTLGLMNIGPSNAIITNVSPPKIRAAAVAINLVVIHFLGDIPSPPLMGLVSDLMGKDLFWGMALTIPTILAGGIFFCLGAPYLERDQKAVLQYLRSAPASTPEALADAVR